jgi:hypothetical protein
MSSAGSVFLQPPSSSSSKSSTTHARCGPALRRGAVAPCRTSSRQRHTRRRAHAERRDALDRLGPLTVAAFHSALPSPCASNSTRPSAPSSVAINVLRLPHWMSVGPVAKPVVKARHRRM